MSKLRDRLERAASGPARPLGFSAGSRDVIPALTIIASFTKPTGKSVKAAVDAGAEFILVDGASAVKSPPKTGDAHWGATVDGLSDSDLAKLREAGCDFLFVSLGGTPVGLLNDESIDYFGIVPAETDERRLRAIERLPFEGSLIEVEPGESLTIEQAIEYAAAASRLTGHLLARASLSWGAGEMEQLRDMGFGGVVVDVKDARQAANVADLREAVMAVPSQPRRRRSRASARLPQSQGGTTAPPPDDGDDDDDFDDE